MESKVFATKSLFKKNHSDAGFDVSSEEMFIIDAGKSHLFSTGLRMEIPLGWFGRLSPRSGLSLKGIDLGAGVIDESYRGEIKVLLRNFGSEAYTVNVGDRIAQIIIQPCWIGDIVVVDELPNMNTTRGANGFGSTGT